MVYYVSVRKKNTFLALIRGAYGPQLGRNDIEEKMEK